jgi:hypothetical protein
LLVYHHAEVLTAGEWNAVEVGRASVSLSLDGSVYFERLDLGVLLLCRARERCPACGRGGSVAVAARATSGQYDDG